MHGIEETLSSRGAAGYRLDVHGCRVAETATAFFSLCESRHVAGTWPRHRPPRPYACVVLDGAFEERGPGREESASAGTMLLHPEDDEHADRFGPSGAVCVNVSPSAAWLEITGGGGGDSLFNEYRAIRGDATLNLGIAIRRQLGATDTAARLTLEAAALALLAHAAMPSGQRDEGGRWIDRVCEEIRSDPLAQWTLAGIAAKARVHPMHVARTFRRRIGSSLGEFVRGERLAWARTALVTSERVAA